MLLAATVAFAWPLLSHSQMPRGSDASYHSQYAHGFVEALGDGILYPRWVNDTNRGYGAPIFIVYPPLSYYAVAVASLLSPTIVDALRLALIAAAFLSGLSFFLAARQVTSELGAAVGAALYVLLPYHVLDLYDRFAVAEFFAFVWFPLLFLGVRTTALRPSWRAWFLLTLSYAGLILTHVMSAYMILFVLGPYALLLTWRGRTWSRLAPMAAAGAAAALCCAVYLVPLAIERDRLHLDWFDEPHYDWRRNFIYRDETAFGYEPDVTKPWATASSTSQAVLAVAAAALLALRLGLRRSATAESQRAVTTRFEGWTHLVLSAWAWFLQTPLSAPLWKSVPLLGAAQFPWRFSALQLLSVSFLAACALAPATRAAPAAAPTRGGTGERGEGGGGTRSRRAGFVFKDRRTADDRAAATKTCSSRAGAACGGDTRPGRLG